VAREDRGGSRGEKAPVCHLQKSTREIGGSQVIRVNLKGKKEMLRIVLITWAAGGKNRSLRRAH